MSHALGSWGQAAEAIVLKLRGMSMRSGIGRIEINASSRFPYSWPSQVDWLLYLPMSPKLHYSSSVRALLSSGYISWSHM